MIKKIKILLVCGFLFLCCMFYFIMSAQKTRMKCIDTKSALYNFSKTIEIYVSMTKEKPENRIDKMITVIKQTPSFNENIKSQHLILSNKDMFGNPFLYKWKPDNNELIVGSCGPNGIDDMGRKDDIYNVIDLNFELN